MGKRLIFVLAIALALSFSTAAYAEVQNLKVSGDLLIRAIDRENFSLSDETGLKYEASGLISATRVRVDADLTDNVSTTVRLLNERSWGQETTTDTEDTDIDLDLAYATLKEFLYSPLTLTVGRQELRFGNALIVGDVDGSGASTSGSVPADLSLRKSFDAIRATLNYDPLVVDIIYSKINENDTTNWYAGTLENRDTNLYGVNAKYDLSALGITGTGEVYYFSRVNRSTEALVGKKDVAHTLGFLVGAQLVENLTGSLEFAYQFGKIAMDATGTNTLWMLDRRAWALQSGLNLALAKKWSPNLALVVTYLSGDETANDRYTFWDPMFEDQSLNNVVNAILPHTNVLAINAKTSLQPAEDVTITGVYGYYHLAKAMENAANGIPSAYGTAGFYGAMTEDNDLGHALDLTATYDYTEDVQLGLSFGYFNPGSAFANPNDHDATQVIGSMKVTF
jgi:hypothetical protein